jgi:hypothetical protein
MFLVRYNQYGQPYQPWQPQAPVQHFDRQDAPNYKHPNQVTHSYTHNVLFHPLVIDRRVVMVEELSPKSPRP